MQSTLQLVLEIVSAIVGGTITITGIIGSIFLGKKLKKTQAEKLAKLEAKKAKADIKIKKAQEKVEAEIKELQEAKARIAQKKI